MLLYFVVQIVGSLITLAMLFLYALFPLNNPLFVGKTRCSRLISQAFRSGSCLSFAAVDCLITEDHQKLRFLLHVLFYSAILSWNTSQLTNKGGLFG